MENIITDNFTKLQIEKYLPKEEELKHLSTFFNIFADGTRIKILSALAISELCVNDL